MNDKLESILTSLKLDAKDIDTQRRRIKEIFNTRKDLADEYQSTISSLRVEKTELRTKMFQSDSSPAEISSYSKMLDLRIEETQSLYDSHKVEVENAERRLKMIEEEFQEQLIEIKRIEQLIQEQQSRAAVKKSLQTSAEEQDIIRKSKK